MFLNLDFCGDCVIGPPLEFPNAEGVHVGTDAAPIQVALAGTAALPRMRSCGRPMAANMDALGIWVMPHRLTLSAAPVLLLPPSSCAHTLSWDASVLGCFPHPPSASNIASENQVCKGENKDVFITTLFSEFTKIC